MTGPVPPARELLSAESFGAVVATVLDGDPALGRERAERMVEEALKFVVVAAGAPVCRLAPAPEVDRGWRALAAHTPVYTALCSLLGRYLPHRPLAEPAVDPEGVRRAVALITVAGYVPDRELWDISPQNRP
ncbi:hypothetical protein ACN20G_19835 [Streptomyces sp. BI20]|uniref:hypothetical protein n=1 Tax=Streptomyces sp. BI20 TaxID=3403460 RepID=UPI003C77D226